MDTETPQEPGTKTQETPKFAISLGERETRDLNRLKAGESYRYGMYQKSKCLESSHVSESWLPKTRKPPPLIHSDRARSCTSGPVRSTGLPSVFETV